ncbi:hypothetical protein AGMMS49543_20880 [Betaproteobacteria bacterium]|nr:hypothetical protein AGMMS49543_20880 [Betaproteobacteria bacterium]
MSYIEYEKIEFTKRELARIKEEFELSEDYTRYGHDVFLGVRTRLEQLLDMVSREVYKTDPVLLANTVEELDRRFRYFWDVINARTHHQNLVLDMMHRNEPVFRNIVINKEEENDKV